MLSTYPPTQCGLATFSAALIENLGLVAASLGVVRVVEDGELPSGPDVVAQLVNGSGESAVAAIESLNGFNVAVVQHEYGIYGGLDGLDVLHRRGVDRADDRRAAHRPTGSGPTRSPCTS